LLPDVAVTNRLLTEAGIAEAVVEQTSLGVIARVPGTSAYAALAALKDSDAAFTFLVDLFGTDAEDGVEVTYHLRSFSLDEELYVRFEVPHGGEFGSVWTLFPAALMPERETAELFGLSLLGHPNPKRLLTTEGIEPLLLKSVAIRTAEEVRNR
jgi:NADH:ubiquinone oxidoreductase subunit C